MFSLTLKAGCRSYRSLIRLYSLIRQTHYEVLNLRKNCSEKEIKEAFIKMSKEYHPDKNKDSRAQDKFVRVVEAYNVLSKRSSRAKYDRTTEIDVNTSTVYRPHTPYNIRRNQYTYYDQYSYNNTQANSNNYNYSYPKPQYTATMRKLPNIYIIMMCFGIAVVGAIIQIMIVREMYIAHQRRARERSRILADELDKVRASAQGNGNEMQTRLLLEKIVNAANPTAATASLGQSLANEKK